MKKYLIAVVGMFVLIGCSYGGKISRISPGMTIQEVQSIMGKYEGYVKIGDYEVYSYYNKDISRWNELNDYYADYHYIVKDGKVVGYGSGEIRQNSITGEVFIVPIEPFHR